MLTDNLSSPFIFYISFFDTLWFSLLRSPTHLFGIPICYSS